MWFKVDDRLHVNRKTRRLLNSHDNKRLDAAPMGLWVLAGSWAGQNTHEVGWVPEYELDRWDDDWRTLVARLVEADFWWPERRDGEPGYAFVNWDEYKPSAGASDDGRRGNHVKWHVNRKKVSPSCEFCPKEPDDEPEFDPDLIPERSDVSPRSSGRIGGDDRGDIGSAIGSIANPSPTRPDTNHSCSSDAGASSERASIDDDFADWYAKYPRKVGKGQAIKAYRAARKKVNHDTLVAALAAQTSALTADGVRYCPHPATWLNGQRWDDNLTDVTVTNDTAAPLDPMLDEHGRYREPVKPVIERWEDPYGDIA